MPVSQFKYQNHFKLTDSDTISLAAKMLIENKLSLLPVTDSTGKYLGVFSMNRLMSLLLPKAVLLEGGLSDVGFLSNRMEFLVERMDEHAKQTLNKVLETTPVIYPRTPLLEVVLHLYRGENDIPVVDEQTGKLLGLLLGADLMAQVCLERK